MIEAKVIEDSISGWGKRITTLQIKFHRFILPEFNTHRMFSRNFSSSRAIPTAKLLEQVRNDPALPVHWGKNQPGMQAAAELDQDSMDKAKMCWGAAANEACRRAAELSNIGAHKQIVNRTIEPYLWAHGVVTATEWDNWFDLRAHEDAQPEIHELALRMKEAMDASTPRKLLQGEWHLPYLREDELIKYGNQLGRQISAARCCRVSYLKHDGTAPNVDEDLALFERLAGAIPLHASPLEHQATPATILNANGCNNFRGWIQHRALWEQEIYNAPTSK